MAKASLKPRTCSDCRYLVRRQRPYTPRGYTHKTAYTDDDEGKSVLCGAAPEIVRRSSAKPCRMFVPKPVPA